MVSIKRSDNYWVYKDLKKTLTRLTSIKSLKSFSEWQGAQCEKAIYEYTISLKLALAWDDN